MNETDELEPQQYENMYWEESVPVKDVRKNTLRKFIYIGACICITFMLIGVFVKFSDQVELPFVFKSDRAEDIFRFPASVYVIEKYVYPGKPVKAGKPLLKITSPEIVEMINNYQDAKQTLLNFEEQKKISVERQKEIFAMGIKQNRNRILQIENEASSLDNIWASNLKRLQYEYENTIKKYDVNKALYEDNIISKFTFLEFERSKINITDSLATAKQSYEREKERLNTLFNNYRLDIIAADAELNKLTIDTKYTAVYLNNQVTLAADKIKNTFGDFEIKDGAIVLLANKTGVIAYIFDGEKEVTAGAILLKIIYNNSPMYASVACPPSMIGKIKKNQAVALKVASFPFYEWGVAKGHIENVSLSPDEKGNFLVKISIKDFGRINNLAQAGMNGNASIILAEKTFYDHFFRKVKKAYHDAILSN